MDNVTVGMETSERLATQKSFYVQISQARDSVTLLTEDPENYKRRSRRKPACSPEMTELTRLEAWIGGLEAATRVQADHLAALRSLMVIEQKMTRIFVASFFSSDSEEQQELIATADEAVEEHLAKPGFLTAKEREKLRREEDAIQNAIQRGDIEPEPRKLEQLEL